MIGAFVVSALIIGFLAGMVAGGGQEAAAAPATVTETVVAEVPAAPVNTPSEPSESTPPVVVAASSGDEAACGLMRQAATRDANSPSWIDILLDAQSEATDYDLQDAIDEAYWTNGDAQAASRVQGVLGICDGLGV